MKGKGALAYLPGATQARPHGMKTPRMELLVCSSQNVGIFGETPQKQNKTNSKSRQSKSKQRRETKQAQDWNTIKQVGPKAVQPNHHQTVPSLKFHHGFLQLVRSYLDRKARRYPLVGEVCLWECTIYLNSGNSGEELIFSISISKVPVPTLTRSSRHPP